MKRHYHSLLSKPVDLFCTNALIYSSVETFEFFQFLGWPLSIITSTAAFRLFLHPLGKSLEKITWKLPKLIEPSCEKLYKALLLNDLENDVRKQGLKSSDLEKLKAMIKPSVLMSQGIQGYLSLNFARGLSQISLNAINHPGMTEPFFHFWTLSTADPFYIAPIVSGCFTFFTLNKSFHPFTLPLTENQRFLMSFLFSLCCLPLPLSYHLSFWTFISVHRLLRR
jgi:hypothetical protein